jgi:hypothetical protein
MIADDRLKLKEKFLLYYRDLPIQKLACNHVGRSEDTIIRWKAEDEDFANQIDDAKAAWAMARSKRVKSQEWLLERVMKDHFAQRSELTGKDGESLPAPIFGGKSGIPGNISNK